MAPIPEDIYKELEESFENLKRISQRPSFSKHDAGDKTQAQTVLHDHFTKLINRIDELLVDMSKDTDESDWIKLIAMKTSLVYEEAKINLTLENFSESKDMLEGSLNVIKGIEMHPLISYLHLRIVNHLGYALSKLGDFVTAKIILKEISSKEIPPNVYIYSTEELFCVDVANSTDGKAKLHTIHINNLQMLSWVYSKMGLESESAMVQHKILECELDYDDCDPVDWAMRCTRVASLYLVRGQFVPARYYLSAAASALDRVEAALMEHPELGKAQAELARGWIYYGLRLFDVSRSKDINTLCNKIFDDTPSTSSEDATTSKRAAKEDEELLNETLKFPNSEVALANVPAKIVNSGGEARNLFQHTQMWLKRARVYYTLRDYPFIYVNCVLDLSELYRFLAFYESDLEMQYGIQKRRADALETLSTILKEVRPQCYIAVSVELLRELAEVQIELMGINLKKMYKMHDSTENFEGLKHRMEGVYDIQTKLDKISSIFGHTHPEFEMNGTGLPTAASNLTHDDIKVSGLDDNQVNSY